MYYPAIPASNLRGAYAASLLALFPDALDLLGKVSGNPIVVRGPYLPRPAVPGTGIVTLVTERWSAPVPE